ncbi:hypothetical protein IAR55_001714 [Kwoniella newhampshirensis]|uniref:SUZ domain-containing protein n=1 Tax=Kwoniella newhampshirensis TaxID=1651941 RepID=A0AAW0Z301_9TREE
MSVIQSSGVIPPHISSPSMATPKPHAVSLQPIIMDVVEGLGRDVENGHHVVEERDADRNGQVGQANSSAQLDGRVTPLADANHSSDGIASGASGEGAASPNPTNISSFSGSQPAPAFNATISHPAEFGLGGSHGEEQLKGALQSKDRIFLLVLAKEIEAFVGKVAAGSATTVPQIPIQGATTSTMAALGPSTLIGVAPSSKFQRMLVYKAAEWYGLKAVPSQDGSMIVGVLESFSEKSISLRLSELVPPAPSPTQKFRIMQRAQPNSSDSADGSGSNDGSGDNRASKWKTLEEREAAYAAAREKIYGKQSETEDQGSDGITGDGVERVSRATAALEDDIEPVPRRRYQNGGAQQFEVTYPSLYHPPPPEPHVPPPLPQEQQYPTSGPVSFSYQSNAVVYSAYPHVDMNGYPVMAQVANGGYPIPQQTQQPPYGIMQQPYMDGGQGYIPQQYQQNAYATQGWQQPGRPNGPYPPQNMPQNQQYNMISPQQNGMAGVPAQGWRYPPMMTTGHAMPMISQGIPYPPPYGYPQHQQQQQQQQHQQNLPLQQRQGMYPPLVQPTPTRPQPQPHSSASSSISSRSYQEGSRPHSRGSTTSTRSAASSVRLGAMYPAGQGPGYRQKGMKGPGMNGLTSLGLGDTKRSTRGHSPSSTTTTSSRSSRRANSIQLAPPTPGQHQLPQRPDWAANNVPYHPSPLPLPNSQTPISPSTAEFPPLLRNGTNAEPMQVERTKMRMPSNGSVWNGAAVAARTLPHDQGHPQAHPHLYSQHHNGHATNGSNTSAPLSPRMSIMSGPSRTRTPHQASTISTNSQQVPYVNETTDPDFPRRVQVTSAPTLFDPSAPKSNGSGGGGTNVSRPASATDYPAANPSGDSVALSPEEVIEAKLAAVSIHAGVSIGPPPARAASYAKVVRKD